MVAESNKLRSKYSPSKRGEIITDLELSQIHAKYRSRSRSKSPRNRPLDTKIQAEKSKLAESVAKELKFVKIIVKYLFPR